MDETDLSIFGKNSKKHDKADTTVVSGDSSKYTGGGGVTSGAGSDYSKLEIVSVATDEDTYNNSNNSNAGIAIILNHKDVKGQKERAGTEKDRDRVKATLLTYGFDVRVFNDLTFEELTEKLKEVAKEDHSNNDCFMLVVMSHGAEGKVYARDMSYPVERLWNPFLGNNCKSLIDKPKLFFVQACRGENLEKAVTFTQTFAPMSRDLNLMEVPAQPEVVTYAIPSTADMLVMYATFDKYFSFRNSENGSWFIQSLCSVFDEAAMYGHAHTEGVELLRLLTKVNRVVAYEYQSYAKSDALNQMKEMPNFLSTLTKTFYLKVRSKKPTQ